MEFGVKLWEILLRLFLAICIGGIIGYDRQAKNRPAGIRTHLLLCVGATLVAILQRQIEADALRLAFDYPQLANVVRADPSRLIAQVVSGVGFLGAGTIIVTKRAVTGLTTAASLWTVACIGLALGMGYYITAVLGFAAVLIVLRIVQHIVHFPVTKRFEIQYTNPQKAKPFILNYFETHKIVVRETDYNIDFSGADHLYINIFTLEMDEKTDYATMIEDLSQEEHVHRIRVVNL